MNAVRQLLCPVDCTAGMGTAVKIPHSIPAPTQFQLRREAFINKDVVKFDELCAKYWVKDWQIIRPSGKPLTYDTYKPIFLADDFKCISSELVAINSTKVSARCLSTALAFLRMMLTHCLARCKASAATLHPLHAAKLYRLCCDKLSCDTPSPLLRHCIPPTNKQKPQTPNPEEGLCERDGSGGGLHRARHVRGQGQPT